MAAAVLGKMDSRGETLGGSGGFRAADDLLSERVSKPAYRMEALYEAEVPRPTYFSSGMRYKKIF